MSIWPALILRATVGSASVRNGIGVTVHESRLSAKHQPYPRSSARVVAGERGAWALMRPFADKTLASRVVCEAYRSRCDVTGLQVLQIARYVRDAARDRRAGTIRKRTCEMPILINHFLLIVSGRDKK